MNIEKIEDLTTLIIYRIHPVENRNLADDYFSKLQEEIEKLKKSNPSFSCEEYNAISNKYEKLIIFKK